METKFYIKADNGSLFVVNDIESLNQFLIPEDIIIEHYKAQIVHERSKGDKQCNVDPILVGVSGEKFLDIVEELKITFNFDFDFVNYIPIRISENGNEVIRVVNTDKINTK